jgi:hypothetical protein
MSFDLWMSRGMDIFVLIVHFLNHNYKFGHVTIGLFEIANTFGTRSWPYKLMRCYGPSYYFLENRSTLFDGS